MTMRRVVRNAPVRSVGEFIDRATAVADRWCEEQHFAPWFRGQPRASDELLPSIYRNKNRNLNELDCRFDFRLRAYPFLEGVAREPQSEWEWYFLMQHHGLPTRLLDWSESALVALYFAVIDIRFKSNPVVWMLDPWAINERIARLGARIFGAEDRELQQYLPADDAGAIPLEPISLQAPYASRCIAAQKGCFTLHGSARKPLDAYAQLSHFLHRIPFSRRHQPQMLAQLAVAGVTKTAVFPDLSNLASELLEYWR